MNEKEISQPLLLEEAEAEREVAHRRYAQV